MTILIPCLSGKWEWRVLAQKGNLVNFHAWLDNTFSSPDCSWFSFILSQPAWQEFHPFNATLLELEIPFSLTSVNKDIRVILSRVCNKIYVTARLYFSESLWIFLASMIINFIGFKELLIGNCLASSYKQFSVSQSIIMFNKIVITAVNKPSLYL